MGADAGCGLALTPPRYCGDSVNGGASAIDVTARGGGGVAGGGAGVTGGAGGATQEVPGASDVGGT